MAKGISAQFHNYIFQMREHFKCKKCDKTSALRQHISKHNGEKPYLCLFYSNKNANSFNHNPNFHFQRNIEKKMKKSLICCHGLMPFACTECDLERKLFTHRKNNFKSILEEHK